MTEMKPAGANLPREPIQALTCKVLTKALAWLQRWPNVDRGDRNRYMQYAHRVGEPSSGFVARLQDQFQKEDERRQQRCKCKLHQQG